MTDLNDNRPTTEERRVSDVLPNLVSGPFTTRRAFLALAGVLAFDTGAGSASAADTTGYGVGDFGEGGFGIGGYRTVEYYADNDGVVRSDGISEAINDWENGVIDMSLLLDVIGAWRSGEVVG